MLYQLNPAIPVYITKKKKTAQALGWLDYGKEENLYWICALDDGGEVWIECNCNIRLLPNYTIGRTLKGKKTKRKAQSSSSSKSKK